MPAYIVAEIVVHDPEPFALYRDLAPASIQAHGGRYLVRGGETTTLEGEWKPKRLVILEFPSMEQARMWWDSDEYADAKRLRQACTSSQFIAAAGI